MTDRRDLTQTSDASDQHPQLAPLRWMSRREFMAAAGMTAAGGAALLMAACSPPGPGAQANQLPQLRRFKSRPDLQPPNITVSRFDPRTAPGVVFLAANGPLIVDDRGDPIWYQPFTTSTLATNVSLQTYQGKPVITWWQGTIIPMGYGLGEYVLYDSTYRQIATVRAQNGLQGDLHEFLLTPSGTALFTAYQQIPYDLRPFGGAKNGKLLDSLLQEVDVATGKLLFEWRASDHVDPHDSHSQYHATLAQPSPSASPGRSPTPAPTLPGETSLPHGPLPYDYFHINSIDVDDDGNLLISARNTWAVYKIARPSGDIIWQLGGKRSSFEMGQGTQFYWQHDARWQPDGTMTLFDDGAQPQEEPHSRALVLAVDQTDMVASIFRQYVHPQGLLSGSQGSTQVLPNGNVFVGYGQLPNFSEFGPGGELLFDASFVGQIQSYRAHRYLWAGAPASLPDIAVERGGFGGHTVYVSWNGATRVRHWRVMGGATADALAPLTTVARSGFETAIPLRLHSGYVAVDALDASGTRLAQSKAVAVPR